MVSATQHPLVSFSTLSYLHPLLDYVDNSTGATYDSIEGRFRIIKKDAAALKAEVDNGDRPEASRRGAVSVNAITPKKTKSTISTPKKEKTLGGRVNKSNATPTKKRDHAIKGIKEEPDSKYDFNSVC